VPPGRPGYELPFANKQCYLAAHNYSMLLEVVAPDDPSKVRSGATWLKPNAVARALPLTTGYLVYMDFDLVITRNTVDFRRKYLEHESNADLVVTDHNIAHNNGAFALRNSPFGRLFLKRWLEVSNSPSASRLPFTDNGSFIEAILSFLPSYQFKSSRRSSTITREGGANATSSADGAAGGPTAKAVKASKAWECMEPPGEAAEEGKELKVLTPNQYMPCFYKHFDHAAG